MALQYGTVTWAGFLATVDKGDAGVLPDIEPLEGYVTFTPSREVTYASGLGTLVIGSITAGIDENGVMRDSNGNASLTLIASNSTDLSHQGWSWEATFTLRDAPPVGPFPFVLLAGTTKDLAADAPVHVTNGVAIIRGPKGETGAAGPKGDKGDPGINGTGAVNSVNGQAGDVLLTYSHVGAAPAGNYVTPTQLSQAVSPKADTSALADVAFTGQYGDLLGRPGGPEGEVPVVSINDIGGPDVTLGLGDLVDVDVPRRTVDDQGSEITPGPPNGSLLIYDSTNEKWIAAIGNDLTLEMLDTRYAPAGYQPKYFTPTLVIQTGDAIPSDFPNGGLIFNRTNSTWTVHAAATLKPPVAPTGLAVVTGSVTANAIGLSWNAVTTTNPTGGPAVTGYAVYQNNVQVKIVSTTATTMTGLTPSTSYTFKVAAINADGTGPASSTVTQTTGSGSAPGAPSNLRTTGAATQNSVPLAWDAGTAGSTPTTSYKVYSNGSTLVGTFSGTSGTVTGLTPGTTYPLTVKAVNSVGESPASNTLSVTTESVTGTAPGAPTSFAAGTPSSTSVPLTWVAGAAGTGGATQGYRVYQGTTLRQTFSGTATSGTLTGLTPSTTYSLVLKAFNAAGESPASNTISVTTTGTSSTLRFKVGSWWEAALPATGTMPVHTNNSAWIANLAAAAPVITFVGGAGQSITNNFWPAIWRSTAADPVYHIHTNGFRCHQEFVPGGPGIRIPVKAKEFYTLSSSANDSPMMFIATAAVAPGGRGYYSWAAMLQWNQGAAPVGDDSDRSGRWELNGTGASFAGCYYTDSYGMSADPIDSTITWPARLTTVAGPNTGVAPQFYLDEPKNGGFRGCNSMARTIDYNRLKAEGEVKYVMELFIQGEAASLGVWPMTGKESGKNGIIPEGARMRLKSTINVQSVLSAKFSGAALTEAVGIAKGLQNYGVIIADHTGSGNHKIKLENTGKEGRGNLWAVPSNAIESFPINTTNWEFSAHGFDPTGRTP